MYKKILVPVDGSELSSTAVKNALEIAAAAGAGITLMHVLELPPQMKTLVEGSPVREQMVEEGKKILGRARENCEAAGVSCDEKLVWGVPAYEIVREGEQGRYDLIVIGNRGLGEVKGWLLGSVSRRVVRHARCPVLVVK
ncbi:MAG: universal stress protein [Peptococcaceae bacterium]|nr:universal stress protein [Peptococcaceae bacterium]